MAFDNVLTCFQYICTLRDHLTKRSLQNHEFSSQNVLNNLSPSVYLVFVAPHIILKLFYHPSLSFRVHIIHT